MQLDAISQGIQAYFNCPEIEDENMSDAYRQVASEIKKEFDRKYKPYWHCVVGNILRFIIQKYLNFFIYLFITIGENFGSFVTHESKNFIFFEIEKKSILLFKSA